MYLILSKACFLFCFLIGQVLSELLHTLGAEASHPQRAHGLDKDKEQMAKPPQSNHTVQTWSHAVWIKYKVWTLINAAAFWLMMNRK